MILHFPTFDTLKLAVTSGIVPTSITLAPARVRIDEEKIWIEPGASLARGLRPKLRKIGASVLEKRSVEFDEKVLCWLQLFPLRKEAGLDVITPQTPVLFELADARQLPELAGEILRLGNDRQSFRGLDGGDDKRVFLRVIGPPYYSLLRALEDRHLPDAVQAYVERAPHLWVALGYRHPLLEQMQAPPGKVVLMQPPRKWRQMDDAPYHDIYDIIEFALPATPVRWADVDLKEKLSVPLRLTRSSSTEPAEVWVLRDRAVEQLDAFVRSADDRLLARLSFAVTTADPPVIVIKARPGKQGPPALDFDGQSFRPYLRLKNLFVPTGKRIEPPLRRDAVRTLLADDPDQVTWLAADESGAFTPESLPEVAFQPLESWIDYVIERERSALESWVRAARFDFEPFVCRDEMEPKKKGRSRRHDADDLDGDDDIELPAPTPPGEKGVKKSRKPTARVDESLLHLPSAKPDELEIRLGELQTQFLADSSPLDDPARREQWRQLALVNTALQRSAEAGLCWLHLLWEEDEPDGLGLKGWLAAEIRAVQRNAPLVDELNRITASKKTPEAQDLRFFTAGVALLGLGDHADADQLELARARQFLENHEGEGLLSVRAIWLAWLGLARLAGDDELAMARARDRLLERLFQFGLGPERDLPTFLRFSTHKQGEKFRNVRDRVLRLRNRARDWIKGLPPSGFFKARDIDQSRTDCYVDLIFAFGLARLGEKTECEKLEQPAIEELKKFDDVHILLAAGFKHRIEQALGGKPHSGPLPESLLEQIEMLTDQRPYAVARLRQQSYILDPDESFNPYRQHLYRDRKGLDAQLALLADVREPMKLRGQIEALLNNKNPEWQGAKERCHVLGSVLQVAPRLGEGACLPLLREGLDLVASLDQTLDPATRKDANFLLYKLAPLLQHGVEVSAHFGQVEFASQFIERFIEAFGSLHETGTTRELNDILARCFINLRKLGLRDEIDRLLNGIGECVLQGESLDNARERLGRRWIQGLCTLLHLAAGWLYFDRPAEARPILDAARELLFQPSEPPLNMADKLALACGYLTALGQAPVELALERIDAFFGSVGNISDTFLSGQYYSQYQLKVVEAVVLAVASEDFAVGAELRRWLDDEEYLVRRRIHADVRGFAHSDR